MTPLAAPQRREVPTLAGVRAHRREILQIAARRGVSNIRLFGSVARGDATSESDVDLLVEFSAVGGGLNLFGFADEVEELLGHAVDIGTEVHPAIRARVERELVPL